MKPGIVLLSAWSALGFYRGVRLYEFELNQYRKYWQRDYTDSSYSIIKGTMTGMFGITIYLFPPTGILAIFKEIARIEMRLLGLNTNCIEYYWLIQ
jgi:hypothetical protein